MEMDFKEFFKEFINDTESDYIEYFFILCDKYDIAIDKNVARSIAKNFLENLSKDKLEIGTIRSLKLLKLLKNSRKINLLLNKITLYIYEKFIEFMKKQDEISLDFFEQLTQHLKNFYNLIENSIYEETQNYSTKIGFGFQNQVYFNNNILDIFQKMKKDSKNIQFMNLYQGILISYEGKILEIDDESVVFKIENELQEIAMKLEGKAYMIKNDYLNRYVKADISYSNFSNKTIVLNNFVYLLNLPAIQREFSRVYPDIFVQVTLENEKNTQLKGNLYDLSMGGLGFISKDNEGFFVGAHVDMKFKLNLAGKEYNISTAGEILNMIEYMNSYRYCLKIFPDTKNLQKIQMYIKLREREIIEELKEELNNYIF
ncbi:MAG: PilZ domain-containing protein [Epsilonproteobacteria bacterium]|nr:PilZ domain-containing protein [Campylobacterota bacterium]